MRLKKKTVLISLILSGLTVMPLGGQEKKPTEDINALMKAGKYRDAVTIIRRKLEKIYGNRVEDKRIPTEFISLKNTTEDVDLKKLFRDRKEKGFFIEDNGELFLLHKQAGECYLNMKDNSRAVNHLVQALRFRRVEPLKDDVLYYMIARAFLNSEKITAYRHFLESAYTLNPEKYEYSKELGKTLAVTNRKRKAIFHLSRYSDSRGSGVEPSILLLLGSLSEDTGKYLKSIDYYLKFLEKKPDNGAVYFSLGVLAKKRTGNYVLARRSFLKALALLDEKDTPRRSRSHEFLGDMALHNRKFDEAVNQYLKTIEYQEKVKKELEAMEKELQEKTEKINRIKSNLLKTQNYDQFEEYELYRSERGKLMVELRKQRLKYEKLNNGRVRWNTAYSYERLGKLAKAVEYYRAVIPFNYRSNDAREKIIKLQLKIKRGY